MTERWRYRCPKGHVPLRDRDVGFHCRTCGSRYTGEPVDAKTVDEWPADDREPLDDDGLSRRAVLRAVVEVCSNETRTRIKCRELPWRSSKVKNYLLDLESDGLIQRIEAQARNWWEPTPAGRRVLGSEVTDD